MKDDHVESIEWPVIELEWGYRVCGAVSTVEKPANFKFHCLGPKYVQFMPLKTGFNCTREVQFLTILFHKHNNILLYVGLYEVYYMP